MNIKRAKEEIKDTIEAYLTKDAHGRYAIPAIRQRPVLLLGPPGIGKTQIMEQIARECQVGLVAYTITHHTRQSAIGLPFITKRTYGGEEKDVTEYTMSEIVASVYEKMEETGLLEGILFIDEINCVSETLAPTMLQFLQCKTFGNHKIPDGWIIVAAGNPPEYNKSVREFDIATLDRIKRIDVEADFAVWMEYAHEVAIHPAICSYLNTKPQYFYQIETMVEGKIFATPRGWEDLSRFLETYEAIGKTVDREVVFQYIQHAKIAKDFANYLELYRKYQSEYQIDMILEGKLDGRLADRVARAPFDERLSVVSLILSKLETRFREVAEKEEFLGLLLGQLKKLKARLFEGDGTAAPDVFAAVLEEFCAFHENRRTANLLSRQEEYRYLDAEDMLNRYFQTVKGESLTEREPLFDRVRALFGEQQAAYDALCGRTGEALEHGFNFMEAAFGDSQETVMFVTELNTSGCAMRFLQGYECERYYQYNKKLLFEDREEELRTRLDRLEGI